MIDHLLIPKVHPYTMSSLMGKGFSKNGFLDNFECLTWEIGEGRVAITSKNQVTSFMDDT